MGSTTAGFLQVLISEAKAGDKDRENKGKEEGGERFHFVTCRLYT